MKIEKSTTISIVILHYNDFELTKNYIDNLEKQEWRDIEYHIIVVDNASPDKSGRKLAIYYKKSEKVNVILLEKNLGFAKGNNVGIQKAVLEYDSDLIVVSNNDILIQDNMFMQKLMDRYKYEKFDVMGPDIFSSRRNFHQSPMREHYFTLEEIKNQIQHIDKTLYKLRIIDKLGIYNLLSSLKKKIKGRQQDVPKYNSLQYGVVLQGAFFVLAKGYMKAYPDGLYPNTFLYMEEDILNYRVLKKGLKALYDPSISVIHMEGVSSLKKNANRCKKYIFELEQTRVSCLVMAEYIKEDMKDE